MNNVIKHCATAFLLALCSCGASRIDEKYAAKVLKDALSISGSVTAEKLQGGFSGAQLFTATADSKKYVVRFLVHKSLEERKREVAILQIASKCDYGPQIYYANVDQGVIIMEFLQQQPISPQLRQSDSLYVLLAQLLQKIHRGPKFEHIQDWDGFTAIAQKIQNLKSTFSKAVPLSKLENINTIIYQALNAHLIKVPCHNDLNPNNLIFLGDKFKVIDYECAAQGDPYLDIAMVAAFYAKPQYEHILLSTYLGRQPTKVEIAKLYLFKIIAWTYCAVCFLTMISDQLPLYEKIQVSSYADFFVQEKIDLGKPEHKLKFAKVMINHVIANFESQEFKHAMAILHEKTS